jgi:hypothetical protein
MFLFTVLANMRVNLRQKCMFGPTLLINVEYKVASDKKHIYYITRLTNFDHSMIRTETKTREKES